MSDLKMGETASKIYNKLTTITIPFSGALVFIASLIAYVFYYGNFLGGQFTAIKIVGLCSLYIVLALATDNMQGIGGILNLVWSIHQTNGLTDAEKMDMIKAQLESAVGQWMKYWKMFQELVNGKEPLEKRWDLFVEQLKKIPKGEINLLQGIWIYGYLVYTLVFASKLLPISAPIDFIVSMGFLLVILFTSGKIRGITDFMGELFKQLAYTDENQIGSKLKLIEQLIMRGAKLYYFLDVQIKEKAKTD